MTGNTRNLVEEYEINPFTMIIIPEEYGSRVYSRVIELEEEYLSPFRPIDIIKKSCKYFGSSYEGRKEGTKQLTGITHKTPIIVDPISSIYFMPTSSPTKPDCIWVSHEHVVFHKKVDAHSTQVTFRNKKSMILPVSHHSFENQLLRTSLLRTKFMQRMKETERKALYLLHGPRFNDSQGYPHASLVSEVYKD
ncbi:competence protein ComK [Bacillus sp. ISL-37]|jgi:competence protein ComK|uniref:competence protein ComK n=1 Tax=Bacillus sp. ISL-37 TaxID=2819123 RepID=UPI001BE6BDF8|nr:competence protein ComK [Bacillus sp. ISL-37]MBT2684310.1 competence protein ComK [Bacillus sp. ISL-37]